MLSYLRCWSVKPWHDKNFTIQDSSMELDDNMILVTVGDEESPDMVRSSREVFKQEKDTISGEKVTSETLHDKGFSVSIKIELDPTLKEDKDIPMSIKKELDPTLKEDKGIPMSIKKELDPILEEDNGFPVLIKKELDRTLKEDEGFPVSIKIELDPILEEDNGFPVSIKKELDLTLNEDKGFPVSIKKELDPTLKEPDVYQLECHEHPCEATESVGKNKPFKASEKFDDFIPSLPWYRAMQNQKCNVADLALKSKDKTVKNISEGSVSKTAKPTLKRKLAELTKKTQKKLNNLAVNFDNNISSLSEFQNIRRRTEQNILQKKKELDDPAVSSDCNIPPSLEIQSGIRIVNPNKKLHVADLDNQNTKEGKNELIEDSAVNSDSNIGSTQLLRRSLVSNPKSYVAELIKQRPELSDDTEALVDALIDIMRQVRPPPPPQDYYITNGVKFECVECGRLSPTIPAASRHYQQRHGTRYLICFACGVDFRSTTNLYKHEKQCIARDASIVLRARARLLGAKGRSRPFLPPAGKPQPPKAKLYPCKLCSATFLSQTGLTTHTNFHLGRRPYVCDECSMAYSSRCALSRHRKKHLSEQFICDHCKCTFSLKPYLVQHMEVHQPQRKFLCAECPQRFAQRAALNMHVRRQHRHLPLPCACAVCHKRFARMYKLKKHMLRKHGMTLMTRKMFYKQLPAMTDTQLMEAKEIVDDDAENIVRVKWGSAKQGVQ